MAPARDLLTRCRGRLVCSPQGMLGSPLNMSTSRTHSHSLSLQKTHFHPYQAVTRYSLSSTASPVRLPQPHWQAAAAADTAAVARQRADRTAAICLQQLLGEILHCTQDHLVIQELFANTGRLIMNATTVYVHTYCFLIFEGDILNLNCH
jgi:hypothetical protein